MKFSPSRLSLLVAGAASALFSPSLVYACPSPAGVVAIIHSSLPERLPEGTVALDVLFEEDLPARAEPLVPARVRRVLIGDFDGEEVLVNLARRTSCHYPFANGRTGLLVGRLREQDGKLVLDPLYVQRRNGFRMRSLARPVTG